MQLSLPSFTALSLAAYLAGCSPGEPEMMDDFVVDAPKTPLWAAWTQFVAQPTGTQTKYAPQSPYPVAAPVIELRFVTSSDTGDGTNCANFWVAHTDASGTVGSAKSLVHRHNPKLTDFRIDVCTLALDADWAEVRIIPANGDPGGPGLPITDGGKATGVVATLPGPHKLGRRNSSSAELTMITLGDSGCKNTDGQDCSSDSDWPLGKISRSAAKTLPDLVVHAGDYRYLGGHGSAGTNSWAYWRDDLLAPTRELLVAAPWAFSRGNHEQCDSFTNGSAGPGFFYLFGANSGAPVSDCLNDISPAWYFDIAPDGIDSSGAAKDPHRVVMIDSSYHRSADLAAQFAFAANSSVVDSTWWITHIPPIDRLNFRNQHGDPEVKKRMNEGMYNARQANPNIRLCDNARVGKPACRPSTMILSHDHMLQTVTFERSGRFIYPQSYIVGNGGVKPRSAGLNSHLCKSFFDLPTGEHRSVRDGHHGIVRYTTEHGYVVWTRSSKTIATPNGWTPKNVWINNPSYRLPSGNVVSC